LTNNYLVDNRKFQTNLYLLIFLVFCIFVLMKQAWKYNLSKVPDFKYNSTGTTDPFLDGCWTYSLLIGKDYMLEADLQISEYVNIYSGMMEYYNKKHK
jgi:hypothetical protein